MSSTENTTEQEPSVTTRIVPALTAFDLLEGEYRKARKSRLGVITAMALTGLAIILLTGQGLRDFAATNSVSVDVDVEQARIGELRRQIDTRADVGGLSSVNALEFVRDRATLAANVARHDLNFSELSEQLLAGAPAELRVTRIEFTSNGGSDGDGSSGSSDNGDETVGGSSSGSTLLSCPSGEALMAGELGPLGVPQLSVSVTARGTSLDGVPEWVRVLRDGIEFVNPTWAPIASEGESGVVVRANVNPLLRSDRTVEFEDEATDGAPGDLNPCRGDRTGRPANTTTSVENEPNDEDDT